MADVISDYVLDNGLTVIDTQADKIYVLSADPTTYSEATTGGAFALGSKVFAAGGVTGAPADATPNGRKVTTNAVNDGSITNTGTATKWAIVDSVNSRLLVHGSLAAGVAVVTGQTFQLPAFVVQLPDQ
jgi:hypothetical protein